MRILVSDTTWNMATVAKLMRDEGFFVGEAADGADIVAHAEQGPYDAVLIDPDLPDMEMTAVIRRIRAINVRMPVIVFAQSRDGKHSARAFAAGADEVVCWPFDSAEVASRIRAYARRAHGFGTPTPEIGGLSVDLDRRSLHFAGESVHLTRLEYELIEMLILAGGRLLDRDTILSKLYGWHEEPASKIIDVYICRLRAKLAKLGAPEKLIATSFARGYRIDGSAGAVPAEAA